jgi:hypothetical protein
LKKNFLHCSGPCSARPHLSCLQVSDIEYTFYMVSGESIYKCGTCVKQLRSGRDVNTSICSLRSALTSEIGKKCAP